MGVQFIDCVEKNFNMRDKKVRGGNSGIKQNSTVMKTKKYVVIIIIIKKLH